MLFVLMTLMSIPFNQFDQIELQKKVVTVSWYGAESGETMASGEAFDPGCSMTVAHKSLPFGTWVIFRNPDNGRVILAQVQDRGPFNRRDFDLSEAGAEALDFKDQGVTELEVVILRAK